MNIDKIKIISLDLDGTLLNNQKEISSYSESILKRLQEKGYIIVLNSGRFYRETKKFVHQLHLKQYHGYVCSCNGVLVYNINKDTKQSFEIVKKEDAKAIMKLALNYHLLTYIQSHDKYYANTVRYQRILFYITKTVTKLIHPILPKKLKYLSYRILDLNVCKETQIPPFPFLEKMCFIGLPFQLKALQKAVKSMYPNYHFFSVNDFSIELVHNSVSKANALAYICEQLNCSLTNVIAFGDSGNDKPLLEQAGIGVIMKHAKSIVRGITPYKSEYTNQMDGVARYLEKYFLV